MRARQLGFCCARPQDCRTHLHELSAFPHVSRLGVEAFCVHLRVAVDADALVAPGREAGFALALADVLLHSLDQQATGPAAAELGEHW